MLAEVDLWEQDHGSSLCNAFWTTIVVIKRLQMAHFVAGSFVATITTPFMNGMQVS